VLQPLVICELGENYHTFPGILPGILPGIPAFPGILAPNHKSRASKWQVREVFWRRSLKRHLNAIEALSKNVEKLGF